MSKPPSIQLETITPEKARQYLEANTDNRAVRSRHVEQLARMMKAGEWTVTHQGIGFDSTGRLVDGQHRLLAILQANVPVSMYVARGLADDSYRNIDGGKPRITSDRLRLIDVPGVNVMACSMVTSYLKNSGGKSGPLHRQPQVDEIENTFLEQTEAFVLVATAFTRKKVRGLTRSAVGAGLACYAFKHHGRCEEFLELFVSGANLKPGSAVLALRSSLISGRVTTQRDEYWKTIAATRYFHEGRDLHALSPATEDWSGGKFKSLLDSHTRRGSLAASTRYGSKGA